MDEAFEQAVSRVPRIVTLGANMSQAARKFGVMVAKVRIAYSVCAVVTNTKLHRT